MMAPRLWHTLHIRGPPLSPVQASTPPSSFPAQITCNINSCDNNYLQFYFVGPYQIFCFASRVSDANEILITSHIYRFSSINNLIKYCNHYVFSGTTRKVIILYSDIIHNISTETGIYQLRQKYAK